MRASSVTLLLSLGCGRVGFDPTAGSLDGGADGKPVDAASLGAFGPPAPIAELDDPSAIDDDPSVTADGLEIYFESYRVGGMGAGDVWRSQRASTSAAWGAPVAVTELNTPGDETGGTLAPDGLTYYFTSNRSGGPGARDVYVATRAARGDAWSTPVLVPEVSTPVDDYTPTPTPDGRLLFVSTQVSGDVELFVAARPTGTGAWSTPSPVTELNSAGFDLDSWIDDAGTTLVYARGGDIYITTRADRAQPFAVPSPIAEVNSTGPDMDPWLSADLREILLVRAGVIYRATR